MTGDRILVTGAHGCIGAWVVHELVRAGREVVTFDLSVDPRRLRLLLGDEVDSVTHVQGDIAEPAALGDAVARHRIGRIIHLAALQIPFVRAAPLLGARVNVIGTVNVFEVAKEHGLGPIVYASSIAALAPDGSETSPPSTLYGVFKRANEQGASVYFAENGVSSVGLRPHTVYGVGRDQGVTSAPTTAMLAAAAGAAYRIPYGGACQLQFARDAAQAFIAASDAASGGAFVHNLPGRRTEVAELVELIGAGASFDEAPLALPEESDSSSFMTLVPGFSETALADGVTETIARFRELLASGLVAAPDA